MAEPNRLAAALSYEQDRPAFGNPSMLEQGRKMRERKQAEQVDRSAQKVKSDLLARALMRRYNPETPPGLSDTGPQTGMTDTPGLQTLDEAAGLDPRVDRSTYLPYSQKEGWHVPAVAAGLMKLATASNPQYSNLMQPEEAMSLATNMMGGGVAASRLAPAPAGSLGMNVWHGTPHRFPPTAKNPLGEFDPTKIGTGEGAQAYGVGAAYLAEAKDLAKHYRDVLAIDPRDSVNSVREALSPTGKGKYWGAGENRAKLDEIYFEMQRHPNLQPYLNDSAFKNDILKVINGTNPDGTVTDEAINILRRLDKTMPKPSGQLYKVDLADEQIPKMLDWDKLLSQQAPEVQKALSGIESKFPKILDFNLRKWMDADPLASTWHNALQRDIGVDPAMISNTLKERGITGIRYLDAGSRNTSAGELIGVAKGADGWQAKIRKTPSGQVGDVIPMATSITTSKSYPTEQAARDWANSQIGGGTSNFVVFDPKHMNIIGRE